MNENTPLQTQEVTDVSNAVKSKLQELPIVTHSDSTGAVWPVITSYSGGASPEGLYGTLWVDLEGNEDGVPYVPANPRADAQGNDVPWTLPHWDQSEFIGRRAETVQRAIDAVNASQTIRWRGAIANAIVNLAARFGPDEPVQVHFAEGDEGVMVSVNQVSVLDTK